MKNILPVVSLIIGQLSCFTARAQTKVIDMHVHSYTDNDFGEREPPTDYYGNKGATFRVANLSKVGNLSTTTVRAVSNYFFFKTSK